MCDFSPTVVSKRIMILFTPLMLLSFHQNFAKSKPNPTPMDQQKPPNKNPQKNGFLPGLGPQSLNQLLIPCFGSHGFKSLGLSEVCEAKRIAGLVEFPSFPPFPCPEVWLKFHCLLEGSQVWQKINLFSFTPKKIKWFVSVLNRF